MLISKFNKNKSAYFFSLITGFVHENFGLKSTMENDFMNELEDFIAGTTSGGSPATSNMASTAPVPTSKSAKDVLGQRIIAKRKLEDQGNNDIMSKTQKPAGS